MQRQHVLHTPGYEGNFLPPFVVHVGIVLDMAPDMNVLAWERETQFSYYPVQQIGRPVGNMVQVGHTVQEVSVHERAVSGDNSYRVGEIYFFVRAPLFFAASRPTPALLESRALSQ